MDHGPQAAGLGVPGDTGLLLAKPVYSHCKEKRGRVKVVPLNKYGLLLSAKNILMFIDFSLITVQIQKACTLI